MITILLEKIITILEGWIQSFASHAQHVEDKLDSLDQTASDIKTNTDPISDIKDNTGAVITPIQNIKTNTDSIATSSTTTANNTTAILNNISTLSTNTGRAAAFAEDCANNTLDIKDKVTTIASDTTQIRADHVELENDLDKIYNAIKWSCVNIETTDTESGASPLSFNTDKAAALVSLKAGIVGSQAGSGDSSPDNVRAITTYNEMNITFNNDNINISFGNEVYSGYVDYVNSKLIIISGSMVLDGVNRSFTNAFGTTSFGFAAYVLVSNASKLLASVCDKFKYSMAQYFQMPEFTFASTSGGVNTFIFILPSTVTTLAEANTWLSNNNTTFTFTYINPVEIPLTLTQLDSIVGKNVITSDTNGDIEVTYKESIKHYLDKQDN